MWFSTSLNFIITAGTFIVAFKGYPPALSLLAGGTSTAGGLVVTGGIAAAAAGAAIGGGINPARAVSVHHASLLSCHTSRLL